MVDRDLVGTLDAGAAVTVDVDLSCISITPERAEVLDFSHAFYETHLAIAAREQGVLKALGIILGLSAVVGGVFYALEHRWNDKISSTKTAFRRVVEAVIVGLLFITKGPFNYFEFEALLGRTLNLLIAAGSTSSAFLRARNVTHRTYIEIGEMLTALDANALDAVVAAAPVLKDEIKRARAQGRLPTSRSCRTSSPSRTTPSCCRAAARRRRPSTGRCCAFARARPGGRR